MVLDKTKYIYIFVSYLFICSSSFNFMSINLIGKIKYYYFFNYTYYLTTYNMSQPVNDNYVQQDFYYTHINKNFPKFAYSCYIMWFIFDFI